MNWSFRGSSENLSQSIITQHAGAELERHTVTADIWRHDLHIQRETSASFLSEAAAEPLTVALKMPGLLLGQVFPDFEAETTTGTIRFHEFLGDS